MTVTMVGIVAITGGLLAQPAAALTPTENFTTAVYQDFILRDPTSSELTWWSAYIGGGGTRSGMLTSILNDNEFATLWAYGVRLYYLETVDTDDPTLPTDIANLQTSNDFVAAEVSVLAGSEFFTDAGATNTGFVEGVYDEVLLRASDAPGLAYWVGQLDLGLKTRSQVARSFIRTTEAASRRVAGLSAAVSCPATSLEDVVDLSAGSYCIVLDRMADAPGASYWSSFLTGSSSQMSSLWTSLAASAEYYTNAQ
ncbi:MAG TPA: DUF4214 domain-containing protein [Iamia sp.]|nr:DUF4214 domain-containing protein [Iamia sp.]